MLYLALTIVACLLYPTLAKDSTSTGKGARWTPGKDDALCYCVNSPPDVSQPAVNDNQATTKVCLSYPHAHSFTSLRHKDVLCMGNEDFADSGPASKEFADKCIDVGSVGAVCCPQKTQGLPDDGTECFVAFPS